jgi:transcriptional/translational regulatory protein YebC/TACO1
MEAALEAGAEDVVVNDDGSLDVVTTPEEFSAVRDALGEAGFDTSVSDVSYNAATQAELDLDTAQKLQRMVDVLEDLDDVQEVYNNADISDEILEQLE